MIDSEYVNRVRIILRGPNIDPVSNEWSRKVGQRQSGYSFGLPLVRLTEDVQMDTCLEQMSVSDYLRINYDKSTSIQSIRIIELSDTDAQCQ